MKNIDSIADTHMLLLPCHVSSKEKAAMKDRFFTTRHHVCDGYGSLMTSPSVNSDVSIRSSR